MNDQDNSNDQSSEYVDSLLDSAERILRPRRRIPFRLISLVILPIILLGAFAIYSLMPLDAPLPDDLGASYSGLERGYTEQGFPRLGSQSGGVHLHPGWNLVVQPL